MNNVLCVGDSITEGAGSSKREHSFVSQLQVLLGKEYRVLNFGRSGATVVAPVNGNKDNYKELPHFRKMLEAAAAASCMRERVIVPVMLGTNDADVLDYGFPVNVQEFNKLMHDRFIAEYNYIIMSVLKVCPEAQFVLCKSPYSYDNLKHKNYGNLPSVWNFQDEIINECHNKNISFTALNLAAATSPEAIGKNGADLYYYDGLHPNDVGHMYLAHFLCNAIRELG